MKYVPNRGENICYANAVLQLLLRVESLMYDVQELVTNDNFLRNLQQLYMLVIVADSPKHIYTLPAVNIFKPFHFQRGMQQDAQEFLQIMLNEISKRIPITDFFETCNTYLKCMLCPWKSMVTTTENIIFLHCIEGENEQTIASKLKHYEGTTSPDEFHCVRCRCTYVTKQQVLTGTAKHLFFCISLFSGPMHKKLPGTAIDKNIKIKSSLYELKGIVYHNGSELNSGHYTSKFQHNNIWFSASDTFVERCSVVSNLIPFSSDRGSTDQPYLILYTKIDQC